MCEFINQLLNLYNNKTTYGIHRFIVQGRSRAHKKFLKMFEQIYAILIAAWLNRLENGGIHPKIPTVPSYIMSLIYPKHEKIVIDNLFELGQK